jgi:hypothetical protein
MARSSPPPHTAPARSIAPAKNTALPPLLEHLIRAAARDSRDRASALTDLAKLFMLIVPMHGVEPAEEVREAIERVAARHLRRADAEAELRRAVARIGSVKDRDAVETACVQVIESGELAHYYAGLAAGITLAELGRSSR